MYRTILALALVIGPATLANAWDRYAAIAYSPSTGCIGWSYGESCPEYAKARALEYCNASDARIAVWVRNGYCALAKGNGPGYFYGWGCTKCQAELNAVLPCAKETSGAHVVRWVFSGMDY